MSQMNSSFYPQQEQLYADSTYHAENMSSQDNPQTHEAHFYQRPQAEQSTRNSSWTPPVSNESGAGAPFYAYVYPINPTNSIRLGPRFEEKLGAATSYLLGWFSGLLLLLFVPKNHFVRFHALQSLIFFGGINLFDVFFFLFIRNHSFFLFDRFEILFFLLINFIAVFAWFVGIITALLGKYHPLPVAGGIAERQFGPGAHTVK